MTIAESSRAEPPFAASLARSNSNFGNTILNSKAPFRQADLSQTQTQLDSQRNTLYSPEYEHDSCGVGFVAQIDGKPSRQIVADALHILAQMEHRGACGCEPDTGDGAGILTGFPTQFVQKMSREIGFSVNHEHIAVGNVFLPRDEQAKEKCKHQLALAINRFGQKLLTWREVPIDVEASGIGATARRSMPAIEQVYIGSGDGTSQDEFERKLFLIRKSATKAIRESGLQSADLFYVCSLSSRTLVYKGMLSTHQLPLFYPDLQDEDYRSHLAMVHSRFSTNTLPNWARAQPLRWMAHNGEINTLRGNRNWIAARQGLMATDAFADNLRLGG